MVKAIFSPSAFSFWSEVSILVSALLAIVLILPHPIPTSQFLLEFGHENIINWDSQMNRYHSAYRLISIIFLTAIGTFWSLTSIPKYLGKAAGIFIFAWRHFMRHIVVLYLAINIYYLVFVITYLGYMRTDIETFLGYLSTKSDGYHSKEFTAIQQKFKCCGVSDPEEWTSSDRNPQRKFPMGCCNRETALICSPKITYQYFQLAETKTHSVLNRDGPHFTDPCSFAVTYQLEKEFYYIFVPKLSLISFLSLFLLFVSLKASHCLTLTAKLFSNPNSKFNFYKHNTFLSNHQLRSATDDFQILAPEGDFLGHNRVLKEHFMEKRLRASWALLRNQTQSKFLNRYDKTDRFRPGQISTSQFRRALRYYCPILEAVLYADGNGILEIQANTYYRNFFVFFVRGIVFVSLGVLMACIILIPLQRKVDNKPLRSTMGKTKSVDIEKAYFRERLTKFFINLNLLIKVAIVSTFLFGSMLSLRVRTMMILILPTMAMNSGRSMLITAIFTETIDGPIENIFENTKTLLDSFKCFSNLIGNITQSAKALNIDSLESTDTGITFAQNIFEDVKTFRDIVSKKINLMQLKGDNFVKSIENFDIDTYWLRYKPKNDKEKSEIDVVENSFDKRMEEIAEDEAAYQKGYLNYLNNKHHRLRKNVKIDKEQEAEFNNTIKKGLELDASLRKKSTKICMNYEKTALQSCKTFAIHACESGLSKTVGIFRGICQSLITHGKICSTSNGVNDAASRCSGIYTALDINFGTGAELYQAKANLKKIVEVYLKLDKVKQEYNKLKDSSSTVLLTVEDSSYQVIYFASSMSTFIRSMAALITTVNLIILIKTLKKSYSYVEKYLTQLDFDNVYIGSIIENIDNVRKENEKSCLMPLKSWEKKKFCYRKVTPTPVEMFSTLKQCIFVIIIIGVNYIIFELDVQVYQILNFIRDLMQTDLSIEQSGDSDDSDKYKAFELKGTGFFYDILKKLLIKVADVGKLKLDFSMKSCAPDLAVAGYESRLKFYILAATLFLVSFFRVVLLRMRHMICSFAFPYQELRRAIHLYNELLVARNSILTQNRILIIRKIEEGELEKFLIERQVSVKGFFTRNDVVCSICMDQRSRKNKDVFVCNIDGTAICKACSSFLKLNNICIVCLCQDKDQRLDLLKKLQIQEEFQEKYDRNYIINNN